MKANWMTKVGLAALMLTGMWQAGAEDVVARVGFVGSLYNNQLRQSITGKVGGNGEYGPLNLEVKLTGSMTSEVGTRSPEKTLTGRYPVEVILKVSNNGINVSDSLSIHVTVHRRSISFGEYGSIRLVRAIDPKKIGRQRIRGTGILRYGF